MLILHKSNKKVSAFLLVLISAILTTLSMPGFLSGIFVWFSLVFLLKALERRKLLGKILFSYLFGIFFLSTAFFWQLTTLVRELPQATGRFSSWVGFFAFVLEVTLLGAPAYALFGFLYGLLKGKFESDTISYSIFTASLYTIIEYLRSIGPFGFTGGRLSDALYKDVGLLQVLPFTGTLGLVFLIVFVNSLIYKIYSGNKKNKLIKIVSVIGIIYILNSLMSGFFVPYITENTGKPLRVMGIQTNFPQEEKYFIDYNKLANSLLSLAKQAEKSERSADLYVFPEAAFIVDVEDIPSLKKKIENFVNELGKPMIIGYPKIGEKKYNQVHLVKPDEGFTEEFYAKMKLTPFVEMLPYPKIFGRFSFLKLVDYYDPGPNFHVFELKDRKFSVQICFESFFSEISRSLVKNGANLLIVATNDGWFKEKVALVQHFSKSVFRAVENRRYVLQVSNTGITGLVDPYGRIIKNLPVKKESFSVFEMYENECTTFYNKYGDWIIVLAVVSLIFIPILRRWRFR
ncbi:MAG: apolipoprotein N-acyltransferase [Thermotogaceae bacterium]|nr:apolipoprotein N-acyltransferase [Thermotogaceae bacterium]MDN5338232.1 apolipoprotein N-acyltransferase [Thermotogaceae bacterium]